MNRINKLFENKKNNILAIYFTAGFPKLNLTVEIINELASSGVDLIEIGIPFSDPIADGPVIQNSSTVALKNGMTLELLFSQLETIRQDTQVPLLFMGYLNPILQYGVEEFCKKCSEIGIDGIIVPDLPMYEYQEIYKPLFEKYNIINIFLITPQTSSERIKMIDKESKGFIYMVSDSATTGGKKSFTPQQINYFETIKKMNLKSPLLLGFGISNKETFDNACKYTNGAIIGSSFITEISTEGDIKSR
ncbi:MAG: tryptophan synthase subunit alpha, partial [Bacteroidales bacterium]